MKKSARLGRYLRVALRTGWRSYRLLVYAALVGMLGGLSAQVFVWMLDWGGRLFMGGIAGYVPPAPGVPYPAPHFGPWGIWLIPVATTVGGLLCGLLTMT